LTEGLLLYDAIKVYIGLQRKTERHVHHSYRGLDKKIVNAKPTVELSPFATQLINKLAKNGYDANGIKTRENTEIVCGTSKAI